MTQRDGDSRVWVNPETGGVESTVEWQRRLNAGDPEAHRQLAELCRRQQEAPPWSAALNAGEGNDSENRTYSELELRTVAFMAAGIGAAAVMRLAPEIVMPSERIIESVDRLLVDAAEGRLMGAMPR